VTSYYSRSSSAISVQACGLTAVRLRFTRSVLSLVHVIVLGLALLVYVLGKAFR